MSVGDANDSPMNNFNNSQPSSPTTSPPTRSLQPASLTSFTFSRATERFEAITSSQCKWPITFSFLSPRSDRRRLKHQKHRAAQKPRKTLNASSPTISNWSRLSRSYHRKSSVRCFRSTSCSTDRWESCRPESRCRASSRRWPRRIARCLTSSSRFDLTFNSRSRLSWRTLAQFMSWRPNPAQCWSPRCSWD